MKGPVDAILYGSVILLLVYLLVNNTAVASVIKQAGNSVNGAFASAQGR